MAEAMQAGGQLGPRRPAQDSPQGSRFRLALGLGVARPGPCAHTCPWVACRLPLPVEGGVNLMSGSPTVLCLFFHLTPKEIALLAGWPAGPARYRCRCRRW